MEKANLISRLIKADYIYASMYGSPKDKKIVVQRSELHYTENPLLGGPAIYFIWGWPGPDTTVLLLKDYGKTWAFEMEDFKQPIWTFTMEAQNGEI